MKLSTNLEALSLQMTGSYERFADDLPMAWVEAALAQAGTATVRRRRLPS